MKIRYLIILLFTTLMQGACISEDNSGCEPESVSSKYLYVKSYMTKYTCEDIVEKVNFYIYDENKVFVRELEYPRSQLEMNGYRAEVQGLRAGKYLVVGVMNPSEDYTIRTGTMAKDFLVSLVADNNDTIARKQRDIFQGHREIIVNAGTGVRDDCDTIPLYKNTNHFNIRVNLRGYHLAEGHSINTHIRANNGENDIYNDCSGECSRIYMPHAMIPPTVESGRIDIITTMKLWVGSDMELVVSEQDGQGITVNEQVIDIPGALAENKYTQSGEIYDTNEKLWQQDEYYLTLEIGNGFVLLGISQGKWNQVEDPDIII